MPSDDPTPEESERSAGELLPEDRPGPEADLLPDEPSEGLAPDPPAVPEFSADDADPELRRDFWSLVLLFNVALFGLSLGVMLIGFEGRWKVGGGLVTVGAFAFARGWYGYRRATDEAGDDETDPTEDAVDEADAES
ncbi:MULTISPECIES: hypothetical protein [Halorussus]|uniref:DUF7322 domain-containing protein n=1 Tax=Halorussus TaxID=1070314 RepID=UPI001878AA14|nr:MULTISPECIES: hypothetical protein [Halorussus]